NRENPGHTICPYPGRVLVTLTIYNAFECDVPILNDYANRLDHWHGIFLEAWISVNSPKESEAQFIVHRRDWQHFDLIVHLLHAFNSLHHIRRVRLQNWLRHLAH